MVKIRSISAASLGVVVLALAGGCESKTGMELDKHQTEVFIHVAPIRKLDLVFMIDNSAMQAKVAKLNSQISKLFSALKDPTNGTYPDLRVAIIDSDLGTGGAYLAGSCGPNSSNGQNAYGDVGNFQMRGSSGCGMTSPDALWIEYAKGSPLNYSGAGDNISKVFACLATNLGDMGCGEEHQLQAFEFALIAQNLHQGSFAKQNDFLRPEAQLGLVFLTDEDDCSAATNDGMFGDKPELRGESASLRCATRGHACNGVGNLCDAGPGYPTSAAFQADLAACSARTDACTNTTDGYAAGTDTSGPTACSPLKSLKTLANEIKALKGNQPAKLLVAGIFGWPLAGADGKPDFASAEPYKIDRVPNPSTADTGYPQGVFDLWPGCYDPNHRPRTAGQFDPEAWSYGAQPGLRLSAFIDEFGDSGLKFSICERDYAVAMQSIGSKLAGRIQNLCIDAKLVDKDPSTPALDPDCQVAVQEPWVDATHAITYHDTSRAPLCALGATPDTVSSDCWELVSDLTKCPASGQLVNLVRTRAEIADGPLPEGTRLAMQCRTCTDGVAIAGCAY